MIVKFTLICRAQLGLQVDEFTAWLNPKGNRELALRNTLTKWWPHIVPGIRKRLAVSHLSSHGLHGHALIELRLTLCRI